jgi:hypothetical protein
MMRKDWNSATLGNINAGGLVWFYDEDKVLIHVAYATPKTIVAVIRKCCLVEYVRLGEVFYSADSGGWLNKILYHYKTV